MSSFKKLKEDNTGKSKGVTVKKNHKDSLFVDLFKNQDYLLDLYKNNLHPEDTSVTKDDLTYITLDNILVNSIYNDLGFRVRDKLIMLVEHQSTINYNMPLRMLFYVSEELKRYIVNNSDLYKKDAFIIPTPEFYVIYTGKDSYEYSELKLSNSYIDNNQLFLELKVKVLENIHLRGKLKEYQDFINLLENAYDRKGKRTLDVAEIRAVIEEAINLGILREYFESRKKEVTEMIKEEFDLNTFINVRMEESKEEGREEGRKEGKEEGRKEGKEAIIDTMISNYIRKNKQYPEIVQLLSDSLGIDLQQAKLLLNNFMSKHKK